jgi:beta-glucosidase
MSLRASVDRISSGNRLPPRSRIDELLDPQTFLWATGIENTVITAPWPGTGRILDEYALTEHYNRWREDLGLMAELGVRTVRYGIPWHRINPQPGRWDWDWADGCLEHLLELGIDPIVDLLHYGLPEWLDGAFLSPDFPSRLADYASRLAERYRGRIRWYTPLNEPRITAWYCGKLGWWPPCRCGWRGFVAVMLAICRGICMTVTALRAVDREIVDVHVDATDVYNSNDPSLDETIALRRALVYLALDLVTGRVDENHELHAWLLKHGASASDFSWFQDNAVRDPSVIGINLYPMFTNKVLSRSAHGLRTRMPYGSADLVTILGEGYWRRYERPVMITETASSGSLARRQAWLHGSVAAVRGLRERGIGMIGYTWWPLFALVGWAYRQGDKAAGEYLVQMGLWDLAAGSDGLERVRTSLVDQYRQLVAEGAGAVGELKRSKARVR